MAVLKVGIIGAGNIAQKSHIPAIKSYKQPVQIVALCSRDKSRLEAVSRKFNIEKMYTDIDEMLKECSLDMISVCTPNNQHFEHVMKGLDAGCHVLCEKPPALTHAETKIMAAKAKDANRCLGYNLHRRYLSEVQVLKRYIDDGSFGKIYHIKASFIRRRGIPGWGAFTNKETQGGGALMDIGIHVLDLALFLLGYPDAKNVLASMYDHIGKSGGRGLMGQWDKDSFTVEDACFAHIGLANGCSITIETAFALNVEDEKNINLHIYGSKMGAVLQPLKLFTEQQDELVNIDFPFLAEVNTHYENIHRFLDTCLGEPSVVCTGDEGAALQKIVECIYASAEQKRAIEFK